jgi:hypothetical protein
MSDTVTSRQSSRRALRPWWLWILTAFAFPPAGLLAHAIVGGVDNVGAAVAAGLIAGGVIGAVQWLFLRTRCVPATWIAGTAAGLAVGLTVGSAIVSYETSLGALVVMGLVSGVGVGVGQVLAFRSLRSRTLEWSLGTGALWVIGWAVTTASGVDVDEQWAVFGISGALVVALLQSFIVGRAAPSLTSMSERTSS